MHAYIHTYIHAYMHTYIHTYIMCVCACVRARVYIYKVAEMTLWAMASLVLALPFALRMVSTLLRLTLL